MGADQAYQNLKQEILSLFLTLFASSQMSFQDLIWFIGNTEDQTILSDLRYLKVS